MKQYAKFELSQVWFEVGDRICKANVSGTLSRWHNNQRDPTLIEASRASIEELEIDILYITVYSDDSLLGRYEGADIPGAEFKYWQDHITAKANKYVADTQAHKHDWVSDESTF